MNILSRLSRSTVVALALAGCGTAAADVAAGPGPTNYTVQPQPAAGSCHYRTAADGQNLPDPNCTPGAVNPKVTSDTLEATICRTGYTKSIRPPKEITAAEKKANAAAYNYTGPLSGAEYDHLLSGALAIWNVDGAGQNVGGMPLMASG